MSSSVRRSIPVALLSLAAATAQSPDAPFFSIISDTIDQKGTERCGAVLIHPDIILTGVECVFEGFGARVGYIDDFTSASQTLIEDWTDHPDAWVVEGGVQFQEHLPNDLTIAKLSEPVTNVEPIKLTDNVRLTNDFATSLKFAHAGNPYDVTNVPGLPPPNELENTPFEIGVPPPYWPAFEEYIQVGTTAVKNFRQCQKAFRDLPGYASELQEDRQYCLEPAANSFCDSHAWGSPVWVETSDGPTLVGLASQGQCDIQSPLGFVVTRVAKYYEWIQDAICRLSSQPPSDCPPTPVPTPMPTPNPTKLPTPSRNYNGRDAETPPPTLKPTSARNADPNCRSCSDTPNDYMFNQGIACDVNHILMERKCKNNGIWRKNKFCQASCFHAGNGYDGDNCC